MALFHLIFSSMVIGNVFAQEPVKGQIKSKAWEHQLHCSFSWVGGEKKKITVVSPLQGYGDWL